MVLVVFGDELQPVSRLRPGFSGDLGFQRTLYDMSSAAFHELLFREESDDPISTLHHLPVPVECPALARGVEGVKIHARLPAQVVDPLLHG